MAQILIVEDDRPFAEALAFTLRLNGHEVFVAYNADDGIQFGLAHHPRVVIADWMLDGELHGGEVCRQIQNACPATKCIIISGYLDALSAVGRQIQGVEAVIAKPFHKEDIIEAVNKALSGALIPETVE